MIKRSLLILMMGLFILSSSLFAGRHKPVEVNKGIRIFDKDQRRKMLLNYHGRMCKEKITPIATLKEWQQRRKFLKKKILAGLGLDPLPPKLPLNPVYSPNKIEKEHCTIQRVCFQTFPGFYAVAFLYMPKNITKPVPGILNPHGHWAGWSADNIVQSRCLGLAKRGYVCLAIQYAHYDDLAIGLTMRGVFLWNNIRGIDFLQSLPQVDKNRIGITGGSGGGLQSMDTAAIDERINVAVIAVYPAYYKRQAHIHATACFCNAGPIGIMKYADVQDIVAMIAPRPTVVMTKTGDWTRETIDKELPWAAKIFDLYKKSEKGPEVTEVTGSQPYRLMTSKNRRFLVERFKGPHDYTKTMRERMYWWFDGWLKGIKKPKPELEEKPKMSTVAELQKLRCPPTGHHWTNANLASVMRPPVLFKPPVLKDKKDLDTFRKKMQKILSKAFGEEGITYGKPVEAKILETEIVNGWSVEKLWYKSEPDVKVPALLIRKPGKTTKKEVVIIVSTNGKNDIFEVQLKSQCEQILKFSGKCILAIDQRLSGEWAYHMSAPGKEPPLTWKSNMLMWGRPELGMAACDIRKAIDYLATRTDCSISDLYLIGQGARAGYAALLAAAMDKRISRTECDLMNADFGRGKHSPVLPNILRYGGVSEIAALVAPRILKLVNLNPHTSMATAHKAYAIVKCSKNLQIPGKDSVPHLVANNSFEERTKGWKCTDNSPPTIFTEKADLGKACLRLLPGKTVASEEIAVEPLTEYRLDLNVSKPGGVCFEIYLERQGGKYKLAGDWTSRVGFDDCSYEFITRPGEKKIKIQFTGQRLTKASPPLLVDSIKLVKGKKLPHYQTDGKNLLPDKPFAEIEIGKSLPKRPKTGQWGISYGPGSENRVIDISGIKGLKLKSSPKTYVAISCRLKKRVERGKMYRFTVTAKGKGRLTMNFWHIPITPKIQSPLTNEWKIYTLDFFVESSKQQNALPTVSIQGKGEIRNISLKLK